MNRIGQKKFSSDENNDYHSAFMQKSKYVSRKACFYIKKNIHSHINLQILNKSDIYA